MTCLLHHLNLTINRLGLVGVWVLEKAPISYTINFLSVLTISKSKRRVKEKITNDVMKIVKYQFSTSSRVVVEQRFFVPVVGQLVFVENGRDDDRINNYTFI